MRKFPGLVIVSFLATIVPFVVAWAHHAFVTGLNPFIGAIFMLLTVLIGVLLAGRLLYVLIKRRIRLPTYSPDILFAMAAVCCLFAAVLEVLLLGHSALDIHLHDTYFVGTDFVGVYRYEIKTFAIFFSAVAAIYYWYPRWFRRSLNATLAYIHFWVTFVAAYFILWPVRIYEFDGLAGMPRRYLDYGVILPPKYFGELNPFMFTLVISIVLAQLLFLFNFFYSLFRRTRATESL